MPAQYKEIAQELVARISKIANIGIVHFYWRNIYDPVTFKAAFFDRTQGLEGRINGWMVTRKSIGDNPLTNYQNERGSLFTLIGYMAVKDSDQTELIFQQVVDDICEEFRPQDSLNGLIETHDPAQVPVIDHGMLGDVLCHHAEIEIRIQELLNA